MIATTLQRRRASPGAPAPRGRARRRRRALAGPRAAGAATDASRRWSVVTIRLRAAGRLDCACETQRPPAHTRPSLGFVPQPSLRGPVAAVGATCSRDCRDAACPVAKLALRDQGEQRRLAAGGRLWRLGVAAVRGRDAPLRLGAAAARRWGAALASWRCCCRGRDAPLRREQRPAARRWGAALASWRCRCSGAGRPRSGWEQRRLAAGGRLWRLGVAAVRGRDAPAPAGSSGGSPLGGGFGVLALLLFGGGTPPLRLGAAAARRWGAALASWRCRCSGAGRPRSGWEQRRLAAGGRLWRLGVAAVRGRDAPAPAGSSGGSPLGGGFGVLALLLFGGGTPPLRLGAAAARRWGAALASWRCRCSGAGRPRSGWEQRRLAAGGRLWRLGVGEK